MSEALVPAAEYIKVENGFAFPSEMFCGPTRGLPLVRIRDIGSQETEVNYDGPYDRRYLLSDGDLIVGMDGEFRAVRWQGGPALLNQRVCRVSSDGRNLDQGFLFHALPAHLERVHRQTPQTTVRHLSERGIKQLKVLPLPLADQLRISEILDAQDDQIQGTERIIAKLRLAGEGLLNDLLAGRTTDEHGSRTNDLSSYSAQTPLENIPKGWSVAQCRELCREITVGIVIRPSQYYREVGIPMLRSANVRSDQIVLDDLKFMSSADHHRMSKTSVKPGDLVTVRTGYPGTTAVIPQELPEANCIDIIVSRPGPRVVSEYLALWINSDFGKGQVLKVQGGLAQQHFNVSEMNSLRVALPPHSEQKKIVELWAGHQARINKEIEVVEKLRLLRKGLEADLLTGRVRVSAKALA